MNTRKEITTDLAEMISDMTEEQLQKTNGTIYPQRVNTQHTARLEDLNGALPFGAHKVRGVIFIYGSQKF